MHVISRKRLLEAAETYRDCAKALDIWYRLIKAGEFKSFAQLKRTFASVDKIGNVYVFNVAGHKLRIVCAIHFDRRKVYVRHVLDHAQYDKGSWKT